MMKSNWVECCCVSKQRNPGFIVVAPLAGAARLTRTSHVFALVIASYAAPARDASTGQASPRIATRHPQGMPLRVKRAIWIELTGGAIPAIIYEISLSGKKKECIKRTL